MNNGAKHILYLLVQVTELPLVHNQKANDCEEETIQTKVNALVPHSYSDYKVFSGTITERNVIIRIIQTSFLKNEINQHVQFFFIGKES